MLISCSACLLETGHLEPVLALGTGELVLPVPKDLLTKWVTTSCLPQACRSGRYCGEGELCWKSSKQQLIRTTWARSLWGTSHPVYCVLRGRSSPDFYVISLVSQPRVERKDVYLRIVPVCVHTVFKKQEALAIGRILNIALVASAVEIYLGCGLQ